MNDDLSPYDKLRLKVLCDSVARMKLGRRVADFGCGTGVMTPILLEKAEHVTGFDFDTKTVDIAREANKGRKASFVRHDLNRPLPDEFAASFDSAVALEIIEHLDSPEAFLDDIARCLKRGAPLLLSTPNLRSPEAWVGRMWARRQRQQYVAWDSTHRNLFTVGKLLRLLRKHSFAPVRVVGYHYDTDVLPVLRVRLRSPLKTSARWPLNRFGFNTVIHAILRGKD